MKPRTIRRNPPTKRSTGDTGISADDELKENIIKAVVSWVLRKILRVKK